MFIADLHIHSRYSRATSRDCVPEMLDLYARRKGLDLIGTGDFTHPAWRAELREKLEPAEDGLYRLKDACRVSDGAPGGDARTPRFLLSGEISSIYKKDGKTRKIHNLILLPDLDAAEALSLRLEQIGNLHSDGRPILGLDSRDLLEITLDVCDRAIFIPAHIWTPHFALFGAYSGFDRIEDCYGDLTPYIHAVETGLSSNPPMNWRLSALDRFTLVSNSDAHSPANLAREANLFHTDLAYDAIARALAEPGSGAFGGTIEFFPEEGKYHCDGHRNCGVCLQPTETIERGGICPVCGGRLTVGVLHRVEDLADRAQDDRPPTAAPFESLVPLPEVVAASTGFTPASGRVKTQVEKLLQRLGPELHILREVPVEDIAREAGPCVAEGVRRLRTGQLDMSPGYDGAYGKVHILTQSDIDRLTGQLRFCDDAPAAKTKRRGAPVRAAKAAETAAASAAASLPHGGLNDEQWAAVTAAEPAVAVIAGPGTGKTHTLVERIAYLVAGGAYPAHITAVTFTNKAAAEMRERLAKRLGKRAAHAMTIGTFHAICLKRLEKRGERVTLLDEIDALALAETVKRAQGWPRTARNLLGGISRIKNGAAQPDDPAAVPQAVYAAYAAQLAALEVCDFDDLLLRELSALEAAGGASAVPAAFTHLLVDEFQDCNPVQYRLLQAWRRPAGTLFVIGDPDQAIYGFRGADAHGFERLKADIPGLRVLRLTQNYRSTPEILRCALPVIGAGSTPRILEPHRSQGAPVAALRAEDDFAEALFIVKEINRMVGGIDMLDTAIRTAGNTKKASGTRALSDIAVLYRTHRQADRLEYCLRREGIPYTVSGRERYLADGQVRRVLAFFRLLLNPGDRLSLRLCLQGHPSLMEADVASLLTACGAQARDLADLTALLRGQGNAALSDLAEALERTAPLIGRETPAALLQTYCDEQGLSEHPAVQRLVDAAALADSLPAFLQNLALGQEADITRPSGRRYTPDAVTLTTLHGAKGLEFPVVFLCGVQQDLLPIKNAKDEALAEERRLFYVGLTRARDELVLLGSGEPSAFLADIPAGCIEEETATRRAYPGKQLDLFDML